jgi:hypothetical protein
MVGRSRLGVASGQSRQANEGSRSPGSGRPREHNYMFSEIAGATGLHYQPHCERQVMFISRPEPKVLDQGPIADCPADGYN